MTDISPKRGEVWTVAGGKDYAGKPRPIVIVQSDTFSGESVTFCGFTSNLTDAEIFRIPIVPSTENGLEKPSQIMIDKITTVSRSKLGKRIGKLEDSEMIRINRSIAVFVGLAD